MATLNIGGQRVTVDDAFLSMSPEQQQSTVDEIANSFQPRSASPEQGSAAATLPQPVLDMMRSKGVRPNPNAQVSPHTEHQHPTPTSAMDKVMTYAQGLTEGIPIAGPLAQRATDFAISQAQGAFTDQTPEQVAADIETRRDARNEANPLQRIGGNLMGGLTSFGALGSTSAGANALGMTGSIPARIGNSALSSGGIAGADAWARGTAPKDIIGDMAIGGAVGGIIPAAGAAIGTLGRGVGRVVKPIFGGATNPKQEAITRLGTAYGADRANPAVPVITAIDEQSAILNNQPLMNIDRGGGQVRALARAASNASPEARAVLAKTADERFIGQQARTQEMLRRVTGMDVDSNVIARQQIGTAARNDANPAYREMFSRPENASIMNDDLQRLMQSPDLQDAIRATTRHSQNVSAISGVPAPQNPFVFKDGVMTMREGVTPSLQFWDHVKQVLDGQVSTAQRAGNANTLMGIRSELKRALDAAVPEYASVRGARYKLFQAEDAIEAGENFAKNGRLAIPEAKQALASMSDAEKQSFQVGFVSNMMRRLNTPSERVNLMRQFKNPAFKEQLELVLGTNKAREIEQFIRVEDIMDNLRGALGNSTTAQQLSDMGMTGGGGVGGLGIALLGGPKAWIATAGRKGAEAMGVAIDEKVLNAMADLLTSMNPTEINRAVMNATLSPAHATAIEAIQKGIGLTARSSLQSFGTN